MLSDFAKEIMPVSSESELKQSYLDYAMSVIVGRALPDVRRLAREGPRSQRAVPRTGAENRPGPRLEFLQVPHRARRHGARGLSKPSHAREPAPAE